MKILVFAHQLVVGGTPLNGIELAAGLRDVGGHDVVVLPRRARWTLFLRCKELRFIAAPQANIYPSPARMKALRAAVSVEKPDLIHVWDWFQCLDAYYAVHLPLQSSDGRHRYVHECHSDLAQVAAHHLRYAGAC